MSEYLDGMTSCPAPWAAPDQRWTHFRLAGWEEPWVLATWMLWDPWRGLRGRFGGWWLLFNVTGGEGMRGGVLGGGRGWDKTAL